MEQLARVLRGEDAEPTALHGGCRSLLNAVGQAVIGTSRDGIIVVWNRAAETLYGWPASEAIGRPVVEVLGSDGCEPILRNREAALAGQVWTAEYNVRRRDGVALVIHVTKSPLRNDAGEVVGVLGVCTDVSEARRTEAALRESEERFRQLAQHLDSIFWMTTADRSRVLYVSPAFETIWGVPVASLEGSLQRVFSYVHPEDRPRLDASLPQSLNGVWNQHYRIVRPDGAVRWIHSRGYPVRDEAGAVYRIVGIATDVTDQVATLRALEHSEGLFRALTENSAEMLNVVDAHGAITYASPAAQRLFGHAP
jgi:PAS domain S-box-containing protein